MTLKVTRGIPTLQQVYEVSDEPEIVTNTVNEAVTIRRGSTADTDNILEGQNGAGSDVFTVTGEGNGVFTGNLEADSRDVLRYAHAVGA